MPKTVSAQCKNFIQQYADFVLDLLAQEIEPKQICTALNLCGRANILIRSKSSITNECYITLIGEHSFIYVKTHFYSSCQSFTSKITEIKQSLFHCVTFILAFTICAFFGV